MRKQKQTSPTERHARGPKIGLRDLVDRRGDSARESRVTGSTGIHSRRRLLLQNGDGPACRFATNEDRCHCFRTFSGRFMISFVAESITFAVARETLVRVAHHSSHVGASSTDQGFLRPAAAQSVSCSNRGRANSLPKGAKPCSSSTQRFGFPSGVKVSRGSASSRSVAASEATASV